MTPSGSHRLLIIAAIAVPLIAASLSSCSGSEDSVDPQEIDGNVVPTMTTDSVNSFVSDSGITRYHIVTPLWLMFDKADEPSWKFPQSLHLERYDDEMNVTATVDCDSATYFTRLKLWRLDGNVRMRNLDGDRFLTEQLFWDQTYHSVYSNEFVHIERTDRIMEGYGFNSNEQMTRYTLRQPTGIFPVSDFTKSINEEAQQ